MAKVVVEIAKGQSAEQVLASLRANLSSLGQGVRILDEDQRRIEATNRAVEARYRSLAGSLDPVIAKTNELDRAERTLTSALNRKIITQEEHDRVLGLAREKANQQSGVLSTLGARYLSTAAVLGAATVAGRAFLGFLSSSIDEASEAERIQRQIEAAITSTGGAAGLSAAQLSDMADELSRMSTFDDDSILKMQSVLLTFTNIRGDAFRAASEAVLDLSTRLGVDLQSAAIQVGKALNDPVQGITALTRVGVSFSEQQKELVRHLVETGDRAGAVQIIIAELNKEFGGSARADLDTYAGSVTALGNAWANLQEAVGRTATENRALAGTIGLLTDGIRVLTSLVTEGGLLRTLDALTAMLRGNFSALYALMDDTLTKGKVWSEGHRAWFTSAAENELLLASAAGISEAAMDAATKAMLKQAAAVEEKLNKALESLLGKLLPIRGGLAEVEAEQKQLAAAWTAGRLPAEIYARALAAIDEQLAALGAKEIVGPPPIEFEPVISDERIQAEARRAAQEFQDAVDALDANGGGIPEKLSDGEWFKAKLKPLAEQAAANFRDSMASGMMNAGVTFLDEFRYDADQAWEDLGKNLTETLIQSAEQWLVEMLAAVLKVKVAAASIQAGGSQTEGGSWLGTIKNLFGSGAGGGGSFAAVGAMAAVVVGAAAYFKHLDDQRRKNEYGTYAEINVQGGDIAAEWAGRLNETGPKVLDAMAQLVANLQDATGSFIVGLQKAQILIQNDKDTFALKINDEIVGYFKSAEEAMVAAAKEIFGSGDLSRQLDPVLQQVFAHFSGGDPQQLVEAVQSVQSILDEVGGLTEIEVELRGLPQQANALANQLQGLGVSLADSERLAAEWTASQLSNLRDQITGRQRTEAEERAERERQAQLFNAQLLLERARTEMERDAIAAKIQIVQAGGSVLSADLTAQANYLQTKSDLYAQDAEINQYHLQTLAQTNNVSLELLQAQLAALDQALAALQSVDLIDPSEIQIRGGGGRAGRVSTGPSREEELQQLLDEIGQFRDQLTGGDFASQLEQINERFSDWRARLEDLGGEVVDLGLLQQQAYRDLGESIVDSLGLGSQQATSEIERLGEAFAFLQDNAELLGISTERLAEIQGELSQQIYVDLLGGIARLIDDQDTLQELEELRYDMQRAYYVMEAARAYELGLLTEAQYLRLKSILEGLPEDLPDGGRGGTGRGGTRHDPRESERERLERERLEEQRRLIAALEDLADLQRDLWGSNLSPLNAEQQVSYLSDQISGAYAEAMRTRDPEAIGRFQDLIRQYLEAYQGAYGSTGSGYTAEFLRVNELINSLLGLGGITGITPGPGLLGGGGTLGGGGIDIRPGTGGGNGNVLPFARSGAPASPFVIESPTLVAELRALNDRLGRVERNTHDTSKNVQDGNRQAARHAFAAKGQGPVGISYLSFAKRRVADSNG